MLPPHAPAPLFEEFAKRPALLRRLLGWSIIFGMVLILSLRLLGTIP